MFRSLFLFDVTFWLYLAAVVLYFGYLVASKKALRPAYAGHPVSSEEDDGWTQPLVPALNSYWIYIHVSITLTSYAAFAMAGGLGVMYLLKERAESRGRRGTIYDTFPSLEKIDELGYKSVMIGFPLLAFGVILGAMWANYAWGGYWSWDPKETWSLIVWLIYGAYIHARMNRGWEGHRAALYQVFGFGMVIFCFWGVNFLLSGLHAYA